MNFEFQDRSGLVAKVCGLTRTEDVTVAIDAGADLVGFVSHGPSPRHLSDLQIVALADALRGSPTAGVLVIVDGHRCAVDGLVADAGLDAVQLCGDERPHDWRDAPYHVLRRVGVGRGAAAELEAWAGVASAFVLDHPSSVGGTGEPVERGAAASLAHAAPCLLAGGLGPDALEGGLVPPLDRAPLVGVDASSGLESAPGLKDALAVARFVRAAHRLPMTLTHRSR